MNQHTRDQQATVESLGNLSGLVAHDDGILRTLHISGHTLIPLYINHAALKANGSADVTTTARSITGRGVFKHAARRGLGVLVDDGTNAVAFSVQEARLLADAGQALSDGTYEPPATAEPWLFSALTTPLLHPATLDLMTLMADDPASHVPQVLSALARAELYLACAWYGDELLPRVTSTPDGSYACCYLTSEPHQLRFERETELVLLEGAELLPAVARHGLDIVGPTMDRTFRIPPVIVKDAASFFENPAPPLAEPGRAARRVWREAAALRRTRTSAQNYPPFLTLGGDIADVA